MKLLMLLVIAFISMMFIGVGFSASTPTNVWVTNYGSGTVTSGTVTELSSTGTTLGTFTVGSYPISIAAGLNGNVWVTNSGNSGNNTITELSNTGTTLETFNVGNDAVGIAIDSNGNVWVANGGYSGVIKYSSTGAILGTFATGTNPIAIAIDLNGNVWITNQRSGTVTELSNTGATLGTYAVGSNPMGIAIDSNGDIWVTNQRSGTVTELSNTGATLGTYAVGSNPIGIATGYQQHHSITSISTTTTIPQTTVPSAETQYLSEAQAASLLNVTFGKNSSTGVSTSYVAEPLNASLYQTLSSLNISLSSGAWMVKIVKNTTNTNVSLYFYEVIGTSNYAWNDYKNYQKYINKFNNSNNGKPITLDSSENGVNYSVYGGNALGGFTMVAQQNNEFVYIQASYPYPNYTINSNLPIIINTVTKDLSNIPAAPATNSTTGTTSGMSSAPTTNSTTGTTFGSTPGLFLGQYTYYYIAGIVIVIFIIIGVVYYYIMKKRGRG